MGPSSTPLLLLLALSFALLICAHSHTPPPSPDASITSVCNKTADPALCVAQVQSVAPNLQNVGPRIVLNKAIDSVIVAVRAAQKKGDSLPKELKAQSTAPAPPTDDPDLAGNPNQLVVCLEKLDDGYDDLVNAQRYLQESGVSSVQSNFDAFSDGITTCAEADTPLKEDSVKIKNMFLNCRGIFDSIWPEASNAYLFPGQGR